MPTNKTASNKQAATGDIDMGYVLRLEPKDAVDYLKAKGLNITWDWHEQLEAAHAKAFTVAKVAKLDVLQDLHEYTTKAIEEGWDHKRYIDELTPLLQKKGWWGKKEIVNELDQVVNVQFGSPYRLKLILDTNKSVAYHVGRYAQQMANVDEQPYWMYMSVKDSRTRPSHLALHGVVYRADDPIWDHIYPPNDWRCRCRVRALSQAQLDNLGATVTDSAGTAKQEEVEIGVDKATGEVRKTNVTRIALPNGQQFSTGAGWNHNVGKAALGNDVDLIRKLQKVQNRELRQAVIQSINNSEARHQAFATWVLNNLGKRGASARYMAAGFVTTDIAEAVTKLSGGEKYSERVLVMTETRLSHANSEKHHTGGIGLSADEYADISRIIANPSVVLWDKSDGHNNLIYVNLNRMIKVIVDAPNKYKLKPQEKLDAVINAMRVSREDLKAKVRGGEYIIIKGDL